MRVPVVRVAEDLVDDGLDFLLPEPPLSLAAARRRPGNQGADVVAAGEVALPPAVDRGLGQRPQQRRGDGGTVRVRPLGPHLPEAGLDRPGGAAVTQQRQDDRLAVLRDGAETGRVVGPVQPALPGGVARRRGPGVGGERQEPVAGRVHQGALLDGSLRPARQIRDADEAIREESRDLVQATLVGEADPALELERAHGALRFPAQVGCRSGSQAGVSRVILASSRGTMIRWW